MRKKPESEHAPGSRTHAEVTEHYNTYQNSPEQKRNRARRNKVRALAMQRGTVHKGDGKEIDHKNPIAKGGSDEPSNTEVKPRTTNRKKGTKTYA